MDKQPGSRAMAVILAYGDSNTRGADPAGSGRLARGTRWTSVMAEALGPLHEVIEEGLNGRTTAIDDPLEPHRNGLTYLRPCMMSHAPLDLVIIALGCNDLKHRFGLSPGDIADGAERLVMTARSMTAGQRGAAPDVLLVAPPPILELAEMFEGGGEKSRGLATRYRKVAERHGVGFIDAGEHIHCSPLDGFHYAADQHVVLGRVMAEAVKARLR